MRGYSKQSAMLTSSRAEPQVVDKPYEAPSESPPSSGQARLAVGPGCPTRPLSVQTAPYHQPRHQTKKPVTTRSAIR
jgi:hypothetical protein